MRNGEWTYLFRKLRIYRVNNVQQNESTHLHYARGVFQEMAKGCRFGWGHNKAFIANKALAFKGIYAIIQKKTLSITVQVYKMEILIQIQSEDMFFHC